MEYSKWPLFTLRAFAVTNFLVAALGLSFLAISVHGVRAGAVGNTSTQPYFIPSFSTMTAINICFLGMLVVGSVCLLRAKMLGVALCNVVFAGEILYFISLGFLWGPPFSRNVAMSMSIAGATGVGNMGLGAQLLCGYPLIALVGLNLARRALNRQRA